MSRGLGDVYKRQTINKSTIIHWHNNLRNIEYQIKTSDNPRLWLEIHLTGLLDNQKVNNLEIKKESKKNSNKDEHENIKNKNFITEKNFSNEIMYVIGDEWHAGNLSYHLSTRPKWFESIKKNVTELDPNGGIVYTGNAEVLKQVCPGDFGKINKQGFCMIGSKIK